MSIPKYNFIFLLHVSRSGSTYLSRLLAENCGDLAVISETNYFRILIAHQKIYKEYQPNKLANLILEDPKFKAFKFSYAEVLKQLQRCDNHKQAIFSVTKMILEKLQIENINNVLIKDGGLVDFIPEIASQFEEFKIIHIKRDPRACINSILHTPKAFYKGRSSMGWDDIEFCVNQYQKYMGKMERISLSIGNILTIAYEDLVKDKNQVVQNVITYLKLQPSTEDKTRTDNYLRKQEFRIHRNIYRSSQIERTDAWQKELKKWEIIYIESRLKSLIPNPSILHKKSNLLVSMFLAKKNHLMGMINLNIYRTRRYLLKGNLNMFFLKVRLKANR